MTLRDIASRIEGLAQAIARDLQIVRSESPLDWPLWTLPAAGLLCFLALWLACIIIAGVGVVSVYLFTVQTDAQGVPRRGIWIVARELASFILLSCLGLAGVAAFGAWLAALDALISAGEPPWFAWPVLCAGVVVAVVLLAAFLRGWKLRLMQQAQHNMTDERELTR